MLKLDQILVAVDFSDTSGDAVRYAKELGRPYDSRIHLLHVVPDPLRQPWAVEAPGLDYPALAQQWRDEADAGLEALRQETGLAPERTVLAVASGAAHTAIIEYAKDHNIDLIVMGTHGHGPVVHLLLGSVAEKVVRQATCPVLVVPHRAVREKHSPAEKTKARPVKATT
ncbi:MAG TPA: universal stress protein [Vicinamibacterales bacterium]